MFSFSQSQAPFEKSSIFLHLSFHFIWIHSLSWDVMQEELEELEKTENVSTICTE